MRYTLVPCFVLCGVSTLLAQQPAPPPDQPSFKSGVELVSIDVGVVDKDGRPIRGLAPADFKVTVGGEGRRVVTAEYVETSPSATAAAEELAPISTNEGPGVGRQFMFVVDANTLELGEARHVAKAASRFLSQLGFADRSSLVSIPVGPAVPFTWAHERVQEALVRAAAIGGASTAWEFGSLSEARDIATRGGFALREVASRECANSLLASASGFGGGGSGGGQGSPQGGGQSGSGGQGGSSGGANAAAPPPGSGPDTCQREIQTRAEMTWAMARSTSLTSITAVRQLFSRLAQYPGDKTLVLISGGWPLDEGDETATLRALAADASAARVTVFTVFVPRSNSSVTRRSINWTSSSDRDLHLWPLDVLASITGGRSYRADASAEGIFDRLSRELAAFYRIGVERNASDTGENDRRMKVQVVRDGLTVRARAIFDTRTYEDRDWAARLARALEAPTAATAVGLRLTSYLAADPEDASVFRLLLAGEVSRLRPGDATLQVLVRDLDGRRIVAGDQQLSVPDSESAPIATNIRVPAGSYIVRLAVQDSAGRVGSVDHRVDVRPVAMGQLSATGPLLVQVPPAGQGEPHFALDVVRPGARLALEVALLGDRSRLAGTSVTFEIAATPDGPPLIQQPATLVAGGRETIVLAQAVADVRVLPPGQYHARAKVAAGDDAIGHLRRAFVVEPIDAAAAETAAAAAATMPGAAAPGASIRTQASAAVPAFAVDHVLSRAVVREYLERIASRPDAAAGVAGTLLTRALSEDLAALNITDAEAAQTPVAAFLQGLTLFAQKNFSAAGTAFRRAMRASPDFYPAMVYLGACYAASGNDKEAAAIWRTALIKESATPVVHRLLGDALLRQGNTVLAWEIIDDARARWPEDEELNRRFVIASLGGGKPADGFKALDDLLERGAADEPSLTLALLVLYESISAGRVIESADDDRERMMRLADAYRERGGPSLPLVEAWVAAVKRP